VLGGFFNGYFSIKEVLTFCDNGFITLSSTLGSFRGKSVVESDPLDPTSTLSVNYCFEEFKVWGPIGQEVPPNDKSYSFVYVDDELAIARIAPSGAVTLLKKLS